MDDAQRDDAVRRRREARAPARWPRAGRPRRRPGRCSSASSRRSARRPCRSCRARCARSRGRCETASRCGSMMSVTSKTALKSGSSKHGNARRQSVACICEVAMTCSLPSASVYVLRYQPRSLSLSVPVNVISMAGGAHLRRAVDDEPLGGRRAARTVASSPSTFTDVDVELGRVEHDLGDRLVDGGVDDDVADERWPRPDRARAPACSGGAPRARAGDTGCRHDGVTCQAYTGRRAQRVREGRRNG